ncbi:MAG TPA: hypothetical protein VG328_12020 [Stellaceae bacterium]|jgi:hypothetical protein|nr:hypothetical protein [Stellaceae bacterium]
MAPPLDRLGLTDIERAARDRILAGEIADFSGAAEKPLLRAAFLDALANAAPPRGLRVKHARIDGTLDLGDASLPALALEHCDIAAPLLLDGARLGRLSIIGSAHAGLRARAATIEGQVDFAGAKPLTQQSWIDLGSAHIRGSVDGCDAQIDAPPARAKEDVPPWDHNYALRLSDTHIDGSLFLNGKVVANGGLCLDNAHVKGSVWARGATIIAGEGDSFHPGDAIHAHCATIDGMLALNFDFHAQGRVWLLGAHIGDRLTVGFGAKLARVGESWDWDNRLMNQTVLLLLDQAEIGGSAHIADFAFGGAISLLHARIGAGLSIIKGKIGNRTADGRGTAIAADGAHIEGSVTIGKKLVAEGKVSLAHARIGGALDCRGATIQNATEDGKGIALDGQYASIADGVLPAGLAESGGGEGFTAQGRVTFAKARTGG